jgi:hypothetical protein
VANGVSPNAVAGVVGFSRHLIVAHDVILFLAMHLKPTWLAEVSIGSA